MREVVVLVSNQNFGNDQMQSVLLTVECRGEIFTALDLLESTDKMNHVIGYCPIKIDALDGSLCIIYDEARAERDKLRVYAYVVNPLEGALKKGTTVAALQEMIRDKEKRDRYWPKASEEHLSEMIAFRAGAYQKYLNGELAIRLDFKPSLANHERLDLIKSVVAKNKMNTSLAENYVSRSQNFSEQQKEPSDRFFIPLPEYEQFKGENVLADSLIPDMREIFRPFSHKAYYSPLWKELMNRSVAQRRAIMESENKVSVGLRFTDEDIAQWVEYPLTHILGDVENDGLPVLENEQEWERAFTEFIRFDLEQEYGSEKAVEYFKLGILSKNMESLYDSFLQEILLLNWSCAGRFRISGYNAVNDDESDDDDDDDVDSSVIAESLYYMSTNPRGFDGIEAIRSHIKRVAHGSATEEGHGCSTYAEALVKLARWGDRRPANLKLNGEPLLFSLETFGTHYASIDFNKLSVKLSEGRPLSFMGLIRLNWVLPDDKYKVDHGVDGKIANVPVGVIALKEFEGEDKIRQVVYLSMLDVIHEYLSGNQLISGLTLDSSGKFICPLDSDCYSEELTSAVNGLMRGQDCSFYVTKALEAVAIDSTIKAIELTELMCLERASKTTGGLVTKWFDQFVLESKNDLKQILDDRTLPIVNAMQFRILKHVLPLYLKYSDEIRKQELNPDFTVGSYFNVMYQLSEAMSVRNSVEFYTIGEVRRSESIPALQAFGAVDSSKPPTPGSPEELAPESEEVNLNADILSGLLSNYVVEDVSSIVNVTRIVHRAPPKGDITPAPLLIGWGGQILRDIKGKPVKTFVLMADSEVPTTSLRLEKSIDVKDLSVFLLRVLGEIMVKGEAGLAPPLMFASTNTCIGMIRTMH